MVKTKFHGFHLRIQGHFPRKAVAHHQVAGQPIDISTKVHTVEVFALIEAFVDEGHAAYARLAVPEQLDDPRVAAHMVALQVEDAADHLQVVLHAVVHLLEQDLLFVQAFDQLLLCVLLVRDPICKAADLLDLAVHHDRVQEILHPQ